MLSALSKAKAALCGFSLLLSCTVLAQQPPDSLEAYIMQRADPALDQYYYSDYDSLAVHFQPLIQMASENQLWHVYFNLLLYQTYCSEEHEKIDTYFELVDIGLSVYRENQQALKNIDTTLEILAGFTYAKAYGFYLVGNIQNAIDTYGQIIEMSSLKPDSSFISGTYSQLGLMFFKIDDYENSLLYYEQALNWLPRAISKYQGADFANEHSYLDLMMGKSLYQQGLVLQIPQEQYRAKNLFFRALHRIENYGSDEISQNLFSRVNVEIAEYYFKEQQLDSSLYFAERILQIPVQGNIHQLNNLFFVGKIYLATKDYSMAYSLFQRSKDLAADTYNGKHYQKAQVLHHFGQWHNDQRQWEKALLYYQQALEQVTTNFNGQLDIYKNPTLTDVSYEKEFLEILILKADALRKWYKEDPDPQLLLGAIDTYQLAMATVDRMRQGFLLSESRQFLSARSVSIYEKALEVCLQAYEQGLGEAYIELAFRTMEQHKSNLLLEAVQDAAAKNYAGVDRKLIEKEQAITSKISYLKRQVSGQTEEDPEKTKLWKQQIFKAQQDYQVLVLQLESDYPEYYQLKYQTDPISLKVLQKALNEDQVLIEYFYGDSILFVMGISKNQTIFKKIPFNQDLRQVLTSYIKRNQHYFYALEPESQSAFIDDGYILYQSLMAPVLDSLPLGTKHLQVIPDGLIGYLPLDILLTKPMRKEKFAFKSLPYLIRRYSISTEFSATLWQQPEIDQANHSFPYLGFAPSFEGPDLAAGRLATRGGEGYSLIPLRYNQIEVVEAQKLFGGKAFLGPAATEADFKAFAPQSKILHLSTHAFARDHQVQYSGLVFYQNTDSTDEDNDGYIYLDELYSLKLSSELAVLSACQTATGELVRGEGIMSLGRAFKYAGCPNIVMSLWSVPDQATSIVMKYFYQELKGGKGKAEALRTAKLRYLEQADANTADPYYWAAFSLIGDDKVISGVKRNRILVYLLIGLIVMLLIIGFWSYLHSKRQLA